MSFAYIWGSLKVPEALLESWLTREVGFKSFAQWPNGLDEEMSNTTPEVIFASLEHTLTEPHEFWKLSRTKGRTDVAACVSSDTFVDVRMSLALLFRSAQFCDGEGELYFLGTQSVAFGYRLNVQKNQSKIEVIGHAEMRTIQSSISFHTLESLVRSHVAGFMGPESAPTPSRPRSLRKSA